MAAGLQHTQYTIRRKVLQLAATSFHVFDPNEQVVFYSKMKAFALKEDIEALAFGEQQQLMARLTGNDKRGNEKRAEKHPRNAR